MRAEVRGRVSFVVVGVRAKDVAGVVEDATIRSWLQIAKADVERAGFGALVIELEWRGWLESTLGRAALGELDAAALAAHARTLTAESADRYGVIAFVNCATAGAGATAHDVVLPWITSGGQGGFRRCMHCGALHLAENASLSHCWGSPTGGHVYDDHGTFELLRPGADDVRHRSCGSCHAVWAFDGLSRGHCPHNPTGHTGGERVAIGRAESSTRVGGWAECTACRRVIHVDHAHAGCVDSTAAVPVAHVLAVEPHLWVERESVPSASWGVRALLAALGVPADLDVHGVGDRPAAHPRFGSRGPASSAAAAWSAGWLPPVRVHAMVWRKGLRRELVLGEGDAAAPHRVLLQIGAPAGLYAAELRPARGLDAHLQPGEYLQLRRLLGRGTEAEAGWRACTACGAAVDAAGLGCAGGGLHVWDAIELAVPFDRGHARAHAGFRWCSRCNGLWHGAEGERGVCPAGGSHVDSASEAFALRPSETATGYRRCSKCRLMVDPTRTGASCPAGAGHELRRSPFYVIEGARRGTPSQRGWSVCRSCGVVGYTAAQRCAKSDGPHALAADDHAAERWRIVSGLTPLWRCSKCQCLFRRPGACAMGGKHRAVGMFPSHGLRELAASDRALAAELPGGAAAVKSLRRSWQCCDGCGVLFASGTGGVCPAAGGKKHRGSGELLAMHSGAIDRFRVLVAHGAEVVTADRDPLRVRVVGATDGGVAVVVEPAE